MGGNQRPRWRVQADLVERVGRRSGHLLLAEGRATGNYRMYDHSVAQAATDVANDVVKVFTSKAGATSNNGVYTPAASCTLRIEYLGPVAV